MSDTADRSRSFVRYPEADAAAAHARSWSVSGGDRPTLREDYCCTRRPGTVRRTRTRTRARVARWVAHD